MLLSILGFVWKPLFLFCETAAGIPKLTVTSGNSVIVPRGNSFQVECTVPANIDYCWLRHPNGTTVPVTVSVDGSEGHHHTSRYQYAGEGLSFGQCLVAVADASTSDTGPWLCALGLRDDRREMYGTVNVTVSGNYGCSNRTETISATVVKLKPVFRDNY